MPLLLATATSARAAQAEGAAWKALTEAEAAILGAFADQVFPPGETPGARDIGAVHFMDAALAGFMAGALPVIRDGCADLDSRSGGMAGSFAELPSGKQTGLLRQVEQTPFFGLVHFLTLCGVFALPAHGGNLDRSGWALLGFEARHAWQPPFGYYDAQGRGRRNDGQD
jgi:hypothetical protein